MCSLNSEGVVSRAWKCRSIRAASHGIVGERFVATTALFLMDREMVIPSLESRKSNCVGARRQSKRVHHEAAGKACLVPRENRRSIREHGHQLFNGRLLVRCGSAILLKTRWQRLFPKTCLSRRAEQKEVFLQLDHHQRLDRFSQCITERITKKPKQIAEYSLNNSDRNAKTREIDKHIIGTVRTECKDKASSKTNTCVWKMTDGEVRLVHDTMICPDPRHLLFLGNISQTLITERFINVQYMLRFWLCCSTVVLSERNELRLMLNFMRNRILNMAASIF